MSGPVRIRLIATADVGNFGDMLFPDLAEHALTRRLAEVELTVHAFRRMGGDDWPRAVEPLSRLAAGLDETDLLMIGGGDLIRFAPPLAPGYGPTEPMVHNPTGLWLAPTLLAAAHQVPVVWSALGARGTPPEWVQLPGRAAVEATTLLTVRDGESGEVLRALAPDATPRIVPDTAFGIAELLGSRESPALQELRRAAGLAGPYVVIQEAPQLEPFAAELRTLSQTARARGMAVVEVPISPALGDGDVAAAELGPVVKLPGWPAPLVLAELIGRAEAVAAQSLHLSIAAVANGVPVHRPVAESGEKYELLMGLPGVHAWGRDSGIGPIGRGAPSVAARELAAQASGYWDDVAAVAQRGPVPASVSLDALLTAIPFELEALRAATAEYPHLRARAAEADELRRRRDELEHHTRMLEKRIVQLETIESELRRRLSTRAYEGLRSALKRSES